MKTGKKYLISTDDWFIAPDGESYKSAFGTVHGVADSAEVLGIKTNARSTNWYVLIGDMLIAGCQIHYVTRTDYYSRAPAKAEIDHEGRRLVSQNSMTRIYDADLSGLVAGS
jgi:hypothetical protein